MACHHVSLTKVPSLGIRRLAFPHVPAVLHRRLNYLRTSRPRTLVLVAAVDKEQVLRDVRIVIAEQLGIDVEAIPPDIKFGDIGADSLDTVEIMMSLEEKFELTLDEEGAEQVRTVQDAADLIARQIDSL